MSDQSLREALERICDDYSAIDIEMLRDLLAAYPVVPASDCLHVCEHLYESECTDQPRPCRTREELDRDLGPIEPTMDRQPSDAAVEAAARGMLDAVVSDDPEAYQSWDEMSQEARDLSLVAGRAALVAAYRVDAPRPSIDRVAVERTLRDRLVRSNFSDNLHEPLRTQVIDQWVDVLAGPVHALLNGDGS
jgi:hypothetical protein